MCIAIAIVVDNIFCSFRRQRKVQRYFSLSTLGVKRIQKRSHEPMNKTDTKNEAERLSPATFVIVDTFYKW